MGHWGIANLLEKEKCHEPSNNRESSGHSAWEEIRIFLQELAVAEHLGEPFHRARKCSSDDGSIPNTRSHVKEASSMLRISVGIKGAHPKVLPVDQAIVWYEQARGKFVWSVSSTMMVLITPMLPLSTPFKARLWAYQLWPFRGLTRS